MTCPLDEGRVAFLGQLEAFERVIRSLPPDGAERVTPFEEWPVRAVAAHVVGTMADIVAGRIENLAALETAAAQADARRDRSIAELADELATHRGTLATMFDAVTSEEWSAPAPGDFPGSLGDAVEALAFDVVVHTDDVCRGAGLPTPSAPGIEAALSHVRFELFRRPLDLEAVEAAAHESAGVGAGELEFVLGVAGRRAGGASLFGLDEPIR